MRAAGGICPGQSLQSGRLHNLLWASVGERMNGEVLACKRNRSARRLYGNNEIVEHQIEVERKAANLLRGEMQRYAGRDFASPICGKQSCLPFIRDLPPAEHRRSG